VTWGLLSFRWFDLSRHWYILPVILGVYECLNLVVGLKFKIRSYWLLAYPMYALFQALVLPPFGLFQYVKYSVRNHLWGRLRI